MCPLGPGSGAEAGRTFPLSAQHCLKRPCPAEVLGCEEVRLTLCSPFEGLPTEGLLHRHPGAPGAHGGGLLEDGLGVEVPRGRDADGAPGERAGQGLPAELWQPDVAAVVGAHARLAG